MDALNYIFLMSLTLFLIDLVNFYYYLLADMPIIINAYENLLKDYCIKIDNS